MADRRPALIARCASPDDVIATVRFARDQDLVVAVRGGGHSVAGFSTCDGGIVIDLSRMRGLTVDPARRVARAEGGAHLSQLDREAQRFGLVCPVGVIGHTGVAGLTLGGGMGRLQRKHGYTIDNLLSVELVTADGDQLRASKDENPDLFWGLRGAGANFGVATSFEFQLHSQDPNVTQGWFALPVERSREVAALVREFVPTIPDDLFVNLSFGLATSPPFPQELIGKAVMVVGVTHSGAPSDAERVLKPLRSGLDWSADTVTPRPYLAVQSMNDEASGWGHRFYMKGGFVTELSDGVIAAAAAHAADGPAGGDCSISFWAQGGAINRVPDDATAFTGRTAGWWVSTEAMWDDAALDQEHMAWARVAMGALKPFTAVGQYVNDAVDADVASVRAIYGDEKYDRLVRLKRKYDPDNVFRLNANIRP
jgi:FAD/FMN-containing dehydrogenase